MKYGYKASIRQDCTHSEREDGRFGYHSSSYCNHFESISKLSKHEKYPELVSDLNIESGELCYVVWFEYSTGDSFGRSDRGRAEVAGVFKEYGCAEALKRAIETDDSSSNPNTMNDHSFSYQTSDGQKFHYGFAPWYGYFEQLEEVHIETVRML